MPSPNVQRELIVFPTELALRRYQQDKALKRGWVDASGHTTFARLRQLCLAYAKLKGRRLGGAEALLLRQQVAGIAHGHFTDGGPLGELSLKALADVLEKLVSALSTLPAETDRIVDWLLRHPPRHKLYQLGILASVWRATLKQEGLADPLDVNTAVLRLLKGGRDKWPPLLRDARKITFRSVRWFNPFEEACVIALDHKVKVAVESALPPAHAEASGNRLGQRIRSEIMDRPWAGWTEDLGDALAVDSPDVLQLSNSDRIGFSRSAGAYGEIEDLARRICWNMQELDMPASRIALVVPNIGAVQDIVPHVFSRFGIPYFFRRGRPVLSSPVVKAFFAWLSFPQRPERDRLIDLVRNPAIRFENREETVEKLLGMPLRLKAGQASLPVPLQFFALKTCSGKQASEILKERIVEPEDHFNASALQTVANALEELGGHTMPLQELVDLLEELLSDATVRPRESHDQGVWILNPHDAVCLEFDLVLFAGLNEGEYPGVPRQDALLNDKERHALRQHLEEQGIGLPKLALPSADVLFEQESVMFLSALGMAREQVVLSYQAVDQEGNEKSESEYYRKLWNIAGWCARSDIEPSPYDAWRIGLLGNGSMFAMHVEEQRGRAEEDRVPMPGESFLPVTPLPLCRARDEALQSAVGGGSPSGTTNGGTASPLSAEPSIQHLVSMLKIEAEREAFLDRSANEREPSVYCGHIPALREKIGEWFERKKDLGPTALETLAQCRYVFLLEHVFGLRDPRLADDMPDPADRGGLIHSILREIYSAIANGEAGIEAPCLWAVRTDKGWVKRQEGGADAIPLAVFVPELEEEYVAFARQVAGRRMDRVVLGHPGVWAAEREKVLEMVLNFVRYDAETCAAENRYPALFELKFGGATAVDLGQVRLHGVIDRVDLVFDDAGALAKIRVLDYKGSSRSNARKKDYFDEIRCNLACQLPVYALAAQLHFIGASNTAEANAMTEAGYLFYQRDRGEVGKALDKSLLPVDEENLLDGFLETLFENIRRLKAGDFAVDPLVETYNDYQSVCRTEAVSREDLE